jgi:predicted Rossmann-fold nucleotide-binding protein
MAAVNVAAMEAGGVVVGLVLPPRDAAAEAVLALLVQPHTAAAQVRSAHTDTTVHCLT